LRGCDTVTLFQPDNEWDVNAMPDSDDGPSKSHVTELLKAWADGESAALEKLTAIIYAELHKLAHGYMIRERSGDTLETTALVNEVYVRLLGGQRVRAQNRAHFMAVCARMMRQVLTDHARAKATEKRGGGLRRVSMSAALIVPGDRPVDFEALDDALNRLSAEKPRRGQVAELRYFGGLSVQETAEVLSVSEETVKLDWRLARIWLRRDLSGGKAHEA
jgi:RNA polymerase sigma-70 factor (ECF subfamily)